MLRRLAREGVGSLRRRSRERIRKLWHALDLRFRIRKRGRFLVMHGIRELSGFQRKRTDGEEALWVFRWHDVRQVLARPDDFAVSVTGQRMRQSIGPFFLGMDPGAAPAGEEAPSYEHDSRAMRAALDVPVRMSAGRQLDGEAWRRLGDVAGIARRLSEHCVRRAIERKGEVDVVTDVADQVPLAFARIFFGIAEPEGGEGLLTWLRAASSYVFGTDVEDKQAAAVSGGRAAAEHVLSEVRARKKARGAGVPSEGHVLDRLIDGGAKFDETIARLLVGTLSGTIIPTGWIFIEAVDRLMRLPRGRLDELMRCAQDGDRDRVRAYVLEAARFFPFPPVLLRRATRSTKIGDRPVEAGTPIVLVLIAASVDRRQIRQPFRFLPERPDEDSLLFGHGTHHCMGRAIGETILTEMATALFSTPGLRRAPGARGCLEYRPDDGVPDGPYPKHLVLEAPRDSV